MPADPSAAPPLASRIEDTPLIGICEPSASAVAPDGRVWIADDDQDTVLFRWQPGPHAPVAVAGPQAGSSALVHDIEGLATDRTGGLWVMGSHSRNKKDRLKRRAQVVRVSATNPKLPTGTSFSWWTDEDSSVPQPLVDAIAAACPDCQPNTPWSTLNLEGLSRGPGTELWMGARAPVLTNTNALVLATEPPLTPGAAPTLTAVHQLALGGRGIRSITPTAEGAWLIAGPAVDGDPHQLGFVLYAWTPGEAAVPLARLPSVSGSPEGLIPSGPHSAWILVDMGDALKDDAQAHPGAAHRAVTPKGKVKFECGASVRDAKSAQWAEAVHVRWPEAAASPVPIR